jgi:hypothetical protein
MRKIRRRRSGEPAPETTPAAAPPPPPPPRTAEELVGGRSGLGASLWALTRRKVRELRGRRWEGATERQRFREAERRARETLSSRIEKETGKRYAARTLRRHISDGTTPGTLDGDKMVRQAAIDNAGSIDKFARSRGMTHSAVVRWREQGGDLPEQYVESLLLVVDFIATLFSKGERYKEDQLWSVEVIVTGEDVARVLEAERTGDYETLLELVARVAVEQFPWVGAAQREFLVTEIVAVTIVR